MGGLFPIILSISGFVVPNWAEGGELSPKASLQMQLSPMIIITDKKIIIINVIVTSIYIISIFLEEHLGEVLTFWSGLNPDNSIGCF